MRLNVSFFTDRLQAASGAVVAGAATDELAFEQHLNEVSHYPFIPLGGLNTERQMKAG